MSETYYRIMDEKGHYVDKYSFQIDPVNSFKWLYFSYVGYKYGSTLYGNNTGEIVDLLDYLEDMSSGLRLHKRFSIVAIDRCNLDFNEVILREEFVL